MKSFNTVTYPVYNFYAVCLNCSVFLPKDAGGIRMLEVLSVPEKMLHFLEFIFFWIENTHWK